MQKTCMIGIIGGSGFIGTILADILTASGCTVRIIDIAPSATRLEAWVKADVRDRAALTAAVAGCDVLYNLAAEHRDDVQPASLYYDVNVTGARNTCEAATAHGIGRIIFTSTVAVYGSSPDELDEAAPLRPFNDYGRSKLEAEQVFRAWAEEESERSLTIVRPTVVFGPGNRGNVYNLLAQIARGRALIIGDGRNRKSMACVENVAGFLAHALRFGPGVHVYNYADKPDLDMNELVALAARECGGTCPRRIPYHLGLGVGLALDALTSFTRRRFSISTMRVKKYCANTQFANARALASGFVPRYSLKDALIKTIRHEFVSKPPVSYSDRGARRLL